MTISGLSAADYYPSTASASTKTTTSSPFQQALTALEKDLSSGDTTDASTTAGSTISALA
jgi:hypothetical protein